MLKSQMIAAFHSVAITIFLTLGRVTYAKTFVEEVGLTGGSIDEYFGYRVAVDGDHVVIAAPGGDQPGYVNVYTAPFSGQDVPVTLRSELGGVYFGSCLAIKGETLVVGESSGYGHNAFVYNVDFEVVQILDSPSSSTSSSFGSTCAMDSNQTLIMGSNGDNQAYIYQMNPSTGLYALTNTLQGAAGDSFGQSVAVSGDYAAVGSPYATINGVAQAGAVDVFTKSSGQSWTKTARLTAPIQLANDHFGSTLDMDGDVIVVGCSGRNSYVGAAFVFILRGSVWSPVAELSPVSGGRNFGADVAISGSTLVVGCPGCGSGAVYTYDRFPNGALATLPVVVNGYKLGSSVDISGPRLVAGSPSVYYETGSATVFYGTPSPISPPTLKPSRKPSQKPSSRPIKAPVLSCGSQFRCAKNKVTMHKLAAKLAFPLQMACKASCISVSMVPTYLKQGWQCGGCP